MNRDAIMRSYLRSIQRGTRTLEQVPEDLREDVSKFYDDWMNSKVEAKSTKN